MRHIIIATAALVISVSPTLAQQKGDAGNGGKLFIKDGCYQCHGYNGQGALMTGPAISRTALSFDQFLHQLRSPASEMAPYEAAVLPDSGAADIYAYHQGMPQSPNPKDLPLLQVTKAK